MSRGLRGLRGDVQTPAHSPKRSVSLAAKGGRAHHCAPSPSARPRKALARSTTLATVEGE